MLESFGNIGIPKAPKRGKKTFTRIGDRYAVEQLHTSSNLAGHGRPECIPVDQQFFADVVVVEIKRFLKVGEDAEIVDDYTCACALKEAAG